MQGAGSPGFDVAHVLKDADTFIVADRRGDISGGSEGLFHQDTRLLSRYRLRLNGQAPILLSASLSRDNLFFRAHLTNQPLAPLGHPAMPQGLLHLARTRFLHEDRLFECLTCTNYGTAPITATIELEFDADFRDMFEVRGSVRPVRGQIQPPREIEHGVLLGYRGLDDVQRNSYLTYSQAPGSENESSLTFALDLPAGGRNSLYLEAGPSQRPQPNRKRFRNAAAAAQRRIRARHRRGARIRTSALLFNGWLQRSQADLTLLTSELETGPYPYAGIPWFSTPFGRDAVITALQTLWLDPRLAQGVLAFLAAHQAQELSPFQDAAPGKILHETRKGEMAALRELPFGLYYGGVDTTPLFVLLGAAYAQRTGDWEFIDRIWPSLVAATRWIEAACEASPFGLVDYTRGQASGLANQGWKDSEDSVFHRDGRTPEGPIALVEVQGYAYGALRGMALLARRRGLGAEAARWKEQASVLREKVERMFWSDERRFYGIAVDGAGRLCDVLTSNAGHLLYVGLPRAERAQQVVHTLLSSRFRTGWGLRTLAEGEARFNPMSYHNGSIWPHDNALCIAGMARYGYREATASLTQEAFEVAIHFDFRMPELFCGFARGHDAAPVAYPVACLPQAWAAGSAFMLMQAVLGVQVRGRDSAVAITAPQLPAGVDELRVYDLQIGAQRAALLFKRYAERVAVFVESNRNPVTLRVR